MEYPNSYSFIDDIINKGPDVNSIKTHISYCTSLLLDLHMAYLYKATMPLSVQNMFISSNMSTLFIEGMMEKYGMPTIDLIWYLNKCLSS